MSEKPDFYEVLGVAKTASEAEIKKAYKLVVMKCHPDVVAQQNKTEAEKKAAGEKFKLATEAQEALSDPIKRATYDQFGHAGLQNIKGSTSKGTSSPVTPAKNYSAEETEAFFDRLANKNPKPSTSGTGETFEQRRARNAEERRKAREAARQGSGTKPSVTEVFTEVTENIVDTTERLKDAAAALPVEVLEKFRDNLKDFIREVDNAIDRARKNGGPRP